ncbi:MAG: hypothetical protein H8D67_04375 [Deltaproteobacteria bacterium]|nr:hypothetical protein [Deltaproteobacteria bacterium]
MTATTTATLPLMVPKGKLRKRLPISFPTLVTTSCAVVGWYRDGFALRTMKSRTGADPATLDTTLAHKRSIFWTKRFGFYILHDQITGSDDKQHTVEQIFHFAPIEEKRGQPDGYRPGAIVIDNRLVAYGAAACKHRHHPRRTRWTHRQRRMRKSRTARRRLDCAVWKTTIARCYLHQTRNAPGDT